MTYEIVPHRHDKEIFERFSGGQEVSYVVNFEPHDREQARDWLCDVQSLNDGYVGPRRPNRKAIAKRRAANKAARKARRRS